MTNTKTKILIIRFSSIGDIVLISPILRCIHQQLGSEVYVLTKKANQSWLSPNPYIQNIIAFDEDYNATVAELKTLGFNYIIDLHKNIRSKRICRMLGVKSFTFDKQNINKWLLVNFKHDRMTHKHIVDRYFDAVSYLNVVNDGMGLDYFIETNPKNEQILSELPQKYIAISLGASYATKRMDIELLIEYVKDKSRNFVLIGGDDVAHMASELEGEKHVVNLVGKINLSQSAMVVRDAELVVTGDSAMMHIAAAFHKKIVAIWGNTTPKFGMEPYYGTQPKKHLNLEVSDLSCRPCSKLGHDRCPQNHFKCMKDIGIVRLNEAVDRLISGKN